MIDRRTFIVGVAGGLILGAAAKRAGAALRPVETRSLPATGVAIPVIGLGSWITFNVGESARLLRQSTEVIRAFVEDGGGMIDSSPMYGSAQATIGHALGQLGRPANVFHTDKVWTSSVSRGPAQIRESARHWGVARFDLLQIHNLRAWEGHLETLMAMKEAGEVRYIGITTSHGRRHGSLERVMREHPIDFVQLTYNPADRAADDRLLPLAQERGIGVIVNRPFQGGRLVDRVSRHALPPLAQETGAASWAQLILQYIVSHPAVTVVIPATTQVDHVRENKAAGRLALLDPGMRRRIADHIRAL